MYEILDIHSHHKAPYSQGIVNINLAELTSAGDFTPLSGQLYSVGVHPWDNGDFERQFKLVRNLASLDCVVAIGEAGIDTLKGGPMFSQLLNFKKHIELSDLLAKPLIIHNVRAHDVILGLRKDFKPRLPWAIHGFRGKPGAVRMLSKSDLYFSIGANFNPESLKAIPADRLLAETDDADVTIESVIQNISDTIAQDATPIVLRNTQNFLYH